MRLTTIIQARMSSTRLPGKVLMRLGDGRVLDHVLRRAREFSDQLVLCTSTAPSDDAIEAFCADRDVICVRGPLDDVFARYRQALQDPRVEHSDWFARVTGDCPLLCAELAQFIMAAIEPGDDYACVHHEGVPRGLTAEFIKTNTFLTIDPNSLDQPEREHVTLTLYENPGSYRCRFLEPPAKFKHPQLRLTLDYPEDHELLQRLLEHDPNLRASQAIAALLVNEELRQINASCVQTLAREALEMT